MAAFPEAGVFVVSPSRKINDDESIEIVCEPSVARTNRIGLLSVTEPALSANDPVTAVDV